MKGYSSHWCKTAVAAILLHMAALLAFSYLLPYMLPEPEVKLVQEMEWIDVEFAEDTFIEDDAPQTVIVDEPVSEEITYYDETVLAEETAEPEDSSMEEDISDEAFAKLEEELEKASSDSEKNDIVVPEEDGNRKMGQAPIVLTEVYPPAGGIQHDGKVVVAATIGKDGKVRKTRVVIGSGRLVIDNIAMSVVSKWTFRPALDEYGIPMVCDKIIIIDFQKLN